MLENVAINVALPLEITFGYGTVTYFFDFVLIFFLALLLSVVVVVSVHLTSHKIANFFHSFSELWTKLYLV